GAIPAAAVGAWSANPCRIPFHLERGDSCRGIDDFEVASLVVAAVGVERGARTGIIPAEYLERAGGGVRGKRLEPRRAGTRKGDQTDPAALFGVADLGAHPQLLGVSAARDVLRNVRRAGGGCRSASRHQNACAGGRNRKIRDLFARQQINRFERE